MARSCAGPPHRAAARDRAQSPTAEDAAREPGRGVLAGIAVLRRRGRGGRRSRPRLPEAEPDRRRRRVPTDRPLARPTSTRCASPSALRGYRMDEVDDVLDRLAAELAGRDARIAELEEPAACRRARAEDAAPEPEPAHVADGRPQPDPAVARDDDRPGRATLPPAAAQPAAADEPPDPVSRTAPGPATVADRTARLAVDVVVDAPPGRGLGRGHRLGPAAGLDARHARSGSSADRGRRARRAARGVHRRRPARRSPTRWSSSSGSRRTAAWCGTPGGWCAGTGAFEVHALPRGRSRFVWSEELDLPLGAAGRLGWPVVRPALVRRRAGVAAPARPRVERARTVTGHDAGPEAARWPAPDGLLRCPWGPSSPDYLAYHDDEWGRPLHGDDRLFERLTLEAFQSGLSWLTILRKRPAFRAAFAGF